MDAEFEYFLESLAHGVMITGASGKIVYTNRFLERMFGYGHGELLGRNVEILMPSEFRELHEQRRAEYAASPGTHVMGTGRDLLGRRCDGSVFPVEVGLSTIQFREGIRIVALITDITTRKHAEQRSILQRDVALILSKADSVESAGSGLLETMGTSLGWRLGALWLVETESRMLRNATFWHATGFEAPDFEAACRRISFRLGEGLLGGVWESGKPEWTPDLAVLQGYLRTEEARANGLRSAFELPIVAGAQTLGVIEFFSQDVRPPDESLIEIAVALASQIAQFVERKRSERALGIFQERYRSLFQNAVFGIIRSTASGEILDANPALVSMLGYDTVDEVLRLNCHRDIYAHAQDRERLVKASRTADRFDGFEVEWKTNPGKTVQVRLSGRTVRDEEGMLAGFEAIVENITQRKSLEEQYRQAQKMEAIGRLAGGVAHDFNNLLTVISVSTDSLMEPDADRESIRRTANEIARAAEQGASLVRQLMAFSRTHPRSLDPVNLNEILRQSQRMLQILAGEDIRFEWNLAGECLVTVESSRLEQILMNIVVNSRDAMPDGGTITISTGLVDIDEQAAALYVGLNPGLHVRLSIADTGHGIPLEIQPHIFEPFFSTKGEEGGGTGLGLSTVYGIVRQHEGHIRCESAPGQGTLFTIVLPTAERAIGAATQPRAPALPSRRASETILLVDDEAALRASVRRILEQTGYRVVVASNGADAIKAAENRERELDLLLTDIALPQMRGTELAKCLLERHPRMRVLYMSGYSEEMISADPLYFIPKPFRREALIRKIREVLDA